VSVCVSVCPDMNGGARWLQQPSVDMGVGGTHQCSLWGGLEGGCCDVGVQFQCKTELILVKWKQTHTKTHKADVN
jgi:hypothetical protein